MGGTGRLDTEECTAGGSSRGAGLGVITMVRAIAGCGTGVPTPFPLVRAAENVIVSFAFAAILLPSSAESTACLSGANRHIASAVAAPTDATIQRPATRRSLRSFRILSSNCDVLYRRDARASSTASSAVVKRCLERSILFFRRRVWAA